MMTGKIEKAEMLAMLVRAEECAEKADALYKQMYNFIWEEHERGKSDIAEEDWKSWRVTGAAAPINMLD